MIWEGKPGMCDPAVSSSLSHQIKLFSGASLTVSSTAEVFQRTCPALPGTRCINKWMGLALLFSVMNPQRRSQPPTTVVCTMEVHLHLPDTLSSFLLFQDLGKQEQWVQFRKPPCIPRHLPGVNPSPPQCTSPRWLLRLFLPPLYPSHQCFASQKPKTRKPSWPK